MKKPKKKAKKVVKKVRRKPRKGKIGLKGKGPKRKLNIVRVSYKNGTLKVSPITATAKKMDLNGNYTGIQWMCPAGDDVLAVSLDFSKDGSPFKNGAVPGSFAAGYGSTSDVPDDQALSLYRYTIIIVPSTGEPPITVDPQVVVDDSGGTP